MISFNHLQAQEVIGNVRVLSNQIQSSDKQKFSTLQKAIREFVNNKKWTTEMFKSEERLECNIKINITEEVSADEYKGTIQIQSSRPVLNTSYYSPLLNYIDNDFQFNLEHQTLDLTKTHIFLV